MFRVTIEVLPRGEAEEAREIAQLIIALEGEANIMADSYVYQGTTTSEDGVVSYIRGRIHRFRKNGHILNLLRQVLNNSEPDIRNLEAKRQIQQYANPRFS